MRSPSRDDDESGMSDGCTMIRGVIRLFAVGFDPRSAFRTDRTRTAAFGSGRRLGLRKELPRMRLCWWTQTNVATAARTTGDVRVTPGPRQRTEALTRAIARQANAGSWVSIMTNIAIGCADFAMLVTTPSDWPPPAAAAGAEDAVNDLRFQGYSVQLSGTPTANLGQCTITCVQRIRWEAPTPRLTSTSPVPPAANARQQVPSPRTKDSQTPDRREGCSSRRSGRCGVGTSCAVAFRDSLLRRSLPVMPSNRYSWTSSTINDALGS